MFNSNACIEQCGSCNDCRKQRVSHRPSCDLTCRCRTTNNPHRFEHMPAAPDNMRLAELAARIALTVATNRSWPESDAYDTYATTYLAVLDAIRDHRS